jgi:tRNA nucleotidyltransferase (CCA-adding enzyme)
MDPRLDKIISEVRKKTTPSPGERQHIRALAKKLKGKVEAAAQKAGAEVKVRVEGSVAKDTWLRESPEIDIFMQAPPSEPKEAFGTRYLDIAKKATSGAMQIERFAEHPYLEAIVDKTRINIVPCYEVEKGAWRSAADRTPFHTDYVNPLLDEELCAQIRLLKRFMQGIGVYGAEIRVGGFSGYVCELLVMFYGSFLQVLEAATDWASRIFIDLEGHYEGQVDDLRAAFGEPLVIVDPVDKGRNAASAVRRQSLNEFVAASRAFLKKPSLRFFYPSTTKAFTPEELQQALEKRGSGLVFVKTGRVEGVPDILWGQLYKSQKALRTVVTQHGFKVVRDAVWSSEDNLNIFLLELQHTSLPPLRKHLGPPVERRDECERFLHKHLDSERTLSGPLIEKGRWVVEIRRKFVDVVELLSTMLREGGRGIGIAERVSQAVCEHVEILVNEEILPTYSHTGGFAEFLAEFIQGKPKWLV